MSYSGVGFCVDLARSRDGLTRTLAESARVSQFQGPANSGELCQFLGPGSPALGRHRLYSLVRLFGSFVCFRCLFVCFVASSSIGLFNLIWFWCVCEYQHESSQGQRVRNWGRVLRLTTHFPQYSTRARYPYDPPWGNGICPHVQEHKAWIYTGVHPR